MEDTDGGMKKRRNSFRPQFHLRAVCAWCGIPSMPMCQGLRQRAFRSVSVLLPTPEGPEHTMGQRSWGHSELISVSLYAFRTADIQTYRDVRAQDNGVVHRLALGSSL